MADFMVHVFLQPYIFHRRQFIVFSTAAHISPGEDKQNKQQQQQQHERVGQQLCLSDAVSQTPCQPVINDQKSKKPLACLYVIGGLPEKYVHCHNRCCNQPPLM